MPKPNDFEQITTTAEEKWASYNRRMAEHFCVSLGWSWKISSARKRTGRTERASYRPGPKRRIDEQALAGLLRARADATLVELQADLEKQSGIRVSTQHLWRVVKRMGFRLKKSHSTPKNGTRKKTASGGKRSSKPSAP